jgi:hypothetical protein
MKSKITVMLKSKTTVMSVVLTSILAALAVASAASAENVTQSAVGSGQFEFTSDTGVTALRTFAFEATKSSDTGSESFTGNTDREPVPPVRAVAPSRRLSLRFRLRPVLAYPFVMRRGTLRPT